MSSKQDETKIGRQLTQLRSLFAGITSRWRDEASIIEGRQADDLTSALSDLTLAL